MKLKIFQPALLIILLVLFTGCKKYLDEKSNKKLVVPANLQDVQALLDYYMRVNSNDACIGESSADNYYINDTDWEAIPIEGERRVYTWEKDQLIDYYPNNWAQLYDLAYIANVALESLDKIIKTPENETAWDNVKGQALFHRARAFQQVAFHWALAYDAETSKNDPGIPLRLDPDFNKTSIRSSVEQTYAQVTTDLKTASSILPDLPAHVMRPSKAAAFGLLARNYLAMRKYDMAGAYADSLLRIKNILLDFNAPEVKIAAQFPFASLMYDNPEIIFESRMLLARTINPAIAKIDSVLYNSYQGNDLRKTIFFQSNGNGTYRYRGSYEGNSTLFSGVSTSEALLIRAECLARQGKSSDAIRDINTLLLKRWKVGTFSPYNPGSPLEALRIILDERRKELVMKGLRWIDLKRLNKDGANITLYRKLKGKTYVLPANDLRYALAIPEDVIEMSGMAQNPR